MAIQSFQDKIIEALRKRISESGELGKVDKEAWFSRITLLLPEAALFLLETFDEAPEEISRINKQIKEKEKILRAEDSEVWNAILQKEKNYIESLLESKTI